MAVLIIGYVMLALLVSTVVMAASSLYIEHKKLLSLADGASRRRSRQLHPGTGGDQGRNTFGRPERGTRQDRRRLIT